MLRFDQTPPSLLAQYNQPVPRYTSFPTVPDWHRQPELGTWSERVAEALLLEPEAGMSLYLHLPYCEHLCTYCACNKRITVNHGVELPYVETLLAEWALYAKALPRGFRPLLRELHLGGGTPTFFAPENLYYLLQNLLEAFELPVRPDWSFEAHPANTSLEHLRVLYDLGFRRLSLGIQDFDPLVQERINRFQTVEQVVFLVDSARAMGYTSINFDLIYGLPFQTRAGLARTLEAVGAMVPDRIAFYGYAHVPWTSAGQRRYTEADLPKAEEKRALYDLGWAYFRQAGYEDIGMDHFALAHDPLSKARLAGRLHRNFMGYTTQDTPILLGLGASAISDLGGAFAQNHKKIETWRASIEQGFLALDKGHVLDQEDLLLRPLIAQLMCNESLVWTEAQGQSLALRQAQALWLPMAEQGLLELTKRGLKVLPLGRPFLRNIASALDPYYQARQREQGGIQAKFSQAI